MALTTRRKFIGTAAAGAFFIPARTLYGQTLPKRQLRMGVVGAGGIGGMTRSELQRAGATVAALCDVNANSLAQQAKGFPGVPVYTDWREMFKHAADFDMVAISTPDHTHAIIALHAMRLGKHVYIQKPLAHTFEECAMLMAEQKRTGVVAQMGTQHHPRNKGFIELYNSGIIGDIKNVYCWTDRPGRWWPQGMKAYPEKEEMIPGFTKASWDMWLGPSRPNPCHPSLAPFKWRGWWDYGCGAIGDMAIHNADPAFEILELGLPTSVTGYCDAPVTAAFPQKGKIVLKFPPSKKCPNGLAFTWLNDSQTPDRIPGMHPKYRYGDNGLLFEGTNGAFNGVVYQYNPIVVSYGGHEWNEESKRVQNEWNKKLRPLTFHNHYRQFVKACHDLRPQDCGCGMGYSAPFCQSLLLGCIALRFPGRELKFDPSTGRFANCPEANAFLKAPSRGDFTMKDFA